MDIESYKMLPMNDYINLVNRCNRFKNENELLKEELKELVDGINKLFSNVMALETIYQTETEDIEEI